MGKVKLIVIVATITVLAGTFYVLETSEYSHQQLATADRQAEDKTLFTIDIVDGRLASGDSVIRVHQNKTITIKITANMTDELHLHGYDKSLQLQPNKTTDITFKASMAGRFEAELHSDKSPVFAVEVHPE